MCKASEFEIVNPCELPTSISPGIETVKVQPCVISDLLQFQTVHRMLQLERERQVPSYWPCLILDALWNFFKEKA